MGKRPDDIYEEIKLTRREISGRVDEMRARGKEDAQEVKERVKDVFQGAGLREQTERRPFVTLLGALGVGIALGMASESVSLRSIAGGRGEQRRSLYGQPSGRRDGLFAGITTALEGAAVEEGRQLLHEWIGNLRGETNGRSDGRGDVRVPVYDERTSAGGPESPYTR